MTIPLTRNRWKHGVRTWSRPHSIASDFADANDWLQRDSFFTVGCSFVYLVEGIEFDQLVEGEAASKIEVDELGNKHVGNAVAFNDATDAFDILHQIVDVEVKHRSRLRSANNRSGSCW